MRSTIGGRILATTTVSPTCRANSGTQGALENALKKVREAYAQATALKENDTAHFHVVIAVER